LEYVGFEKTDKDVIDYMSFIFLESSEEQ